jgi:hypothetical protein
LEVPVWRQGTMFGLTLLWTRDGTTTVRQVGCGTEAQQVRYLAELLTNR